jgi:Na+/proline symporter
MLVEFGVLNTGILVVYLAGMVSIGVVLAGRQRTTEDYFLAGRNMPWLAVGMSMFASLTSATTYMGVPAFAYGQNVAMIFGVVMSLAAAPILARLFYPVYRRHRVTTSYEYIQLRYGPNARRAVSALFVLGRLGWLGIVIYAPAKAMSVASGMPLNLAIALMGLLAVTYTVLGGALGGHLDGCGPVRHSLRRRGLAGSLARDARPGRSGPDRPRRGRVRQVRRL